ncbi:MAG: sulfur carrier protein ThiS [Gammaproteobacteria bacterium]
MQIILNGETRSFEKIVTIQDLLDNLQLNGRLAVEVNQEIIPRSLFRTRALQAGDTIEIVHAIGGG